MTPQRAVCRTASGAGVRGSSEQSIHSGLRRGGGAWGDTHALLSRADGILGISPSRPTGSLFLQGGPSLGTLRQAVTPSLSTLSTGAATPIPSRSHVYKGQARRNGLAQKQRGLGVGWQGACLELVRAGTPCQDKVRSCPPLTAHPIWPRSALPTRRASRRLKITEASLY